MSEPKPKSFDISKRVVWEAWLRVKANKGAAGVDEQSIAEFERDLKGTSTSSGIGCRRGAIFPPPVRAVQIPKRDGSPRVLGVPTVADRIAQTVVRLDLEPGVEPYFHPDSYGYRPGRSALDAVGVCRERCWRSDWVLDLDIRSFFDSVPHDLVLKAVAAHTEERWVLLYVERWLKAPLQNEDGSLLERDRGTPQGSAISPLLANMFLHYAFDSVDGPGSIRVSGSSATAMTSLSTPQANAKPACCGTRSPGGWRNAALELNEQKTRIVYCKDSTRGGSHEHTSFDFLGYTFRPRLSRNKVGGQFVNFLPAASDDARKRMRREVRRWRLHLRPDKTISDLARIFNPIIRGWINYYGRFYRSVLNKVLRRINAYLVRWAQCKYKRLRRHPAKARRFLVDVFRRQPDLFAHWRFGVRPDGWTMGAR